MNTLNETLAELCKSMDICYVATCAFDTAHLPTLPQDTLQQSLPYSAKWSDVSTTILLTWVSQRRTIESNVTVARIGSIFLKAAEFLLSH